MQYSVHNYYYFTEVNNVKILKEKYVAIDELIMIIKDHQKIKN